MAPVEGLLADVSGNSFYGLKPLAGRAVDASPLAALGLRVMPCADARRAPGVLAALTSVVHECESTDDHEHQRGHNDQCGDLHSQPIGPDPARAPQAKQAHA